MATAVWAQDVEVFGDLDGRGVTPSTGQGLASDPLYGWSAWSAPRKTWAAGVTFEWIESPLRLELYQDRDTPSYERYLVDDLAVLTLGGSVAVTDRLGVSLTAPIVLSSANRIFELDADGNKEELDADIYGPALGEVRLALPTRLVSAEALGLDIAAIPYAELPAIPREQDRYVGSSRPGIGAIGAFSLHPRKLTLHANLGYELSPGERICSPECEADNDSVTLIDHRSQAFASLAASYPVWRSLELQVGAFAAPAIGDGVVLDILPGVQQGSAGDHTWSFFDTESRSVSTPAEAWLMGRYGLPRGLAVQAGAALPLSSAPGTASLRVFAGVTVQKRPEPSVEPNLGPPPILVPGPTDLVVDVDDPRGQAVKGQVGVEGREQVWVLDDDGHTVVPLGIGSWRVTVEADGYGRQVRVVVIEEGRAEAETLDVVLQEDRGEGVLELAVVDAQDRAVDEARLTVDDADYGEVGNAGVIRVEGLAEGDAVVDVSAEDFQDFDSETLNVLATSPARTLVLDRLPGSVRIIARGPDGPLSDALVRLLGPEVLDPVQLDTEGRQVIQLTPGQWTAVLSSEVYGLQQRDILIEEDFTGLVDVVFNMVPAEGGEAALAVRVIDPDGQPVEGAEVLLDGTLLGSTASGGSLRVEGLDPGTRALEVRGARFRPRQALDVQLDEGLREVLVTLDWLPGSLKVVARTADGPIEDALIRFSGPGQLDVASLGPDGEGFFALEPGDWTVVISAEALGLQQRDVIVEPDQTSLLELKAVLLKDEGGDATLTVNVVDPDGHAVNGAEVLLDGALVGTTSTGGGLTLGGLSSGARSVTVRGSLLREQTVEGIALKPGDNAVEVALRWKPGSVRVRTRGGGGAVLDALVRLIGPEHVAPTRVGPDGERVFSLAPGDWTVVVSSESYGLEQRDVAVAPEQEALVALDFELAAVTDASVVDELPLRPVDIIVKTTSGAPVVADLRFLGPERVDAGTTRADGTLRATLRPASWELIASAPDYGARRAGFVLDPGDTPYSFTVELKDTQVKVTAQEVRILQQVFFETDKAVIRPESYALLDEVANTLVVNPQIRLVEVQGHTDSVGSAEYNQQLSEDRANAVRQYLIDKGVSARRLQARGYGNTRPLGSEETEAGRAENRRVQFEIVEQD
ncbi:MAG: OmpA family protein [Alphaproteobacteria bacterium]|nr:OmpA family protein [Alphaproteobacteria bacterium]